MLSAQTPTARIDSAAIAVYDKMLHFIDSTGALSCNIDGFVRELAMLMNVVLQLLGIRSMVIFNWVPPAANVADWPTR